MESLPWVRAPELPVELEWVGQQTSLAAQRGRWVLLDFWSSGCINCVHLVPVLHATAMRWHDVLTVIGVHSGKFPAERESAHTAHECARLGVVHPVVNDRHFRVWRSYAVRAWPTLVLINPRGYVVAQHVGEITAEALHAALAEHIGAEPQPEEEEPRRPTPASTTLRYPSRIAMHEDGRQIAIADAGHDRVLLGEWDPNSTTIAVRRVVGGTPGLRDGGAREAQFRDPQGLVFSRDALWVADRGNHAIRRVSLADGAVITRAGTGSRLRPDAADGALASPMDLCIVDGYLLIAMAGTHQLWAAPLEQGTPRPVAGSGAEGLHDGPAMTAAFAQPTGLARLDRAVYVADCESSAVRVLSEPNAPTVETVVGTGLFDFGDRDGTGDAVRLQHVEALVARSDHRLLAVDRYNGALKVITPSQRRADTVARDLVEPTGACSVGDDGAVLVVECHAHRIRWIDPSGRSILVTLLDAGAHRD
jgi:thiol-disulfide isomerase/thioredoxin